MKQEKSGFSAMQGEAGLLDVLVTLAENVKLLIIGPLVVGLCALGITFVLPRTYQSTAILQADQSTASLMMSASVLDPVIGALGLAGGDTLEKARRELREQIKAVVGRGDKLLTLTVSARSAQQSQDIANALLRQSYLESRPKGTARGRLQTQLQEAQLRLRNAQNASLGLLKRLQSDGVGVGRDAEAARGYADLLNATGAAQTQISALEAELEGLSESKLLQAPTLPQQASHPRKGLVALGATLAAQLALLLFVFMRQALRNTAAANAEASRKVVRIRQCLGLK